MIQNEKSTKKNYRGKIYYKAVRNVKPPKITPAVFGIIRIQSFLGSLVQP